MPTFLSKRLRIFEKIFLIKFMHEKVDSFLFYSDIDRWSSTLISIIFHFKAEIFHVYSV